MLKKTMKRAFTKKINDWLDSIEDTSVKEAIARDLIVTGGALTSMISNEPVNDFDCYFKTKETAKKVARYYIDKWNKEHKDQENKLGKKTKLFLLDGADPDQDILNYYDVNADNFQNSLAVMISNTPPDRLKIIFPSDGVVREDPVKTTEDLDGLSLDLLMNNPKDKDKDNKKEIKKYTPVFMSSNAITLSNDIQIIIRFYGRPEELHSNFDFTHTKAYTTFIPILHNDKVTKVTVANIVIPEEVYECVTNKTLRYTKSKYPLCSLFRIRKFLKRGWHINAGQILKIAFDLQELDLKDINTLEDQLIGVDSVYFNQLIVLLKEKKLPTDTIGPGNIISLIDKIF